jgi:hypothetical protein
MDEQVYELIKNGTYVLGGVCAVASVMSGISAIARWRYSNNPETVKANESTKKHELDLKHRLDLERLASQERRQERELSYRVQRMEVERSEFSLREDHAQRRMALMSSPVYLDYAKKREEVVKGIKERYEEADNRNSFSDYDPTDLEIEVEMMIGPNPLKDLLEDLDSGKENSDDEPIDDDLIFDSDEDLDLRPNA